MMDDLSGGFDRKKVFCSAQVQVNFSSIESGQLGVSIFPQYFDDVPSGYLT